MRSVVTRFVSWRGSNKIPRASVSFYRARKRIVFCDRCGASLEVSQNFCPTCGKSVRAVPVIARRSRVSAHLTLLAILWLAMSAFRLFPGLILLAIFRPGNQFLPPEVPPFVHGLVQMIGLMFLGAAALGVVTAWGLLQRQPWARMLAIVFACFSLFDIPFGTALGVYTLWVLLPAESEREYHGAAAAA